MPLRFLDLPTQVPQKMEVYCIHFFRFITHASTETVQKNISLFRVLVGVIQKSSDKDKLLEILFITNSIFTEQEWGKITVAGLN